jgi:hypothetical protein
LGCGATVRATAGGARDLMTGTATCWHGRETWDVTTGIPHDPLNYGAAAISAEYSQMTATFKLWSASAARTPGEKLVEIALLESCLLHARALVEFLVGRNDGRGGRWWDRRHMRPSQFAPAWQAADTAIGPLDAAKDTLNEYLAHLTVERTQQVNAPQTPAQVTRWVKDLVNHVNAIYRDFAHAAVAYLGMQGEILETSIRLPVV